MTRQFRRYCFSLAERLGMTVKRLLDTMDSQEISEWMAFDLTNNEEWLKAYNQQREMELDKQRTDEQRLAAFKRVFRGGPNG